MRGIFLCFAVYFELNLPASLWLDDFWPVGDLPAIRLTSDSTELGDMRVAIEYPME